MSDITVTVVGVTNVSASILASDSVAVSTGSGFSAAGVTNLMVEAGANITVTTAQGSFTIVGRDIPVLSVNGRTGTVVLTASDIGGLTAVGNVTKVNGRTGAVTLVSTDVSAASAAHSHVAANITDLTSVANVVSVNGITGTPTIVAGANVTVSSSGSSITISASGGGGTTGGSVASVNGKVGTVVLTSVDVSAASASHSHVAANITDLTSVANVVSVNGKTGAVSLVATDVTAASASHGHSYVTSLNGNTGAISVVAGSNVTVTTSSGSIVIAASTATQGAQGPPGSFADPQTISLKTASYTLQVSDVGTLLRFDGSTASLGLFVPTHANANFPVGSHIDIVRTGPCTVTVSAVNATATSVLSTPGPRLRAAGSGATLVCLGQDDWVLVGDLDTAS